MGNCGNFKNKFGSSKRYKYKKCFSVIDRGINAARNTLLRFLAFNTNNGQDFSALKLPLFILADDADLGSLFIMN